MVREIASKKNRGQYYASEKKYFYRCAFHLFIVPHMQPLQAIVYLFQKSGVKDCLVHICTAPAALDELKKLSIFSVSSMLVQ